MATLLMNLRNVPDDEAEEVRALLDAHSIDWYETKPSAWGVSHGGIWTRRADQVALARAHLAAYQQQRASRARAQREADLREGRVESVWEGIRRRPFQSLLALAGIVLMLLIGLVMLPFLLLR